MDGGQVVNSVARFEVRPQHETDSTVKSLKKNQSHVTEVGAFSCTVLKMKEVSGHMPVARLSLTHKQEAEKG